MLKRFLDWRKAKEPEVHRQQADEAVVKHDDKATNEILNRNLP